MPDKFLYLDTQGRPREKELSSSSSGVGDAGKGVALGTDGKLDLTFFPAGIGTPVSTFTASEALAAGDLVNLWSDSGTVKARKADASVASKQAHGYVKSAVSANAQASVYTEHGSLISGLTGMTAGSEYFLSATVPGGAATAIPSGAGQLVQYIGIAKSATELYFEPEARAIRA